MTRYEPEMVDDHDEDGDWWEEHQLGEDDYDYDEDDYDAEDA